MNRSLLYDPGTRLRVFFLELEEDFQKELRFQGFTKDTLRDFFQRTSTGFLTGTSEGFSQEAFEEFPQETW